MAGGERAGGTCIGTHDTGSKCVLLFRRMCISPSLRSHEDMHTKTLSHSKAIFFLSAAICFFSLLASNKLISGSPPHPFVLVHICLFPPYPLHLSPHLHLSSLYSSSSSFLPSFPPPPLPPLCRAAGETGISLTAGGESAPGLGPR